MLTIDYTFKKKNEQESEKQMVRGDQSGVIPKQECEIQKLDLTNTGHSSQQWLHTKIVQVPLELLANLTLCWAIK